MPKAMEAAKSSIFNSKEKGRIALTTASKRSFQPLQGQKMSQDEEMEIVRRGNGGSEFRYAGREFLGFAFDGLRFIKIQLQFFLIIGIAEWGEAYFALGEQIPKAE